MVWNRFNLLIIVQVLLIALVGFLIVLAMQAEFLKMTVTGLILLWVGQVFFLMHYMHQIHRDVSRFMEGLRSQDTTRYFNQQKGGHYFRELYASFNGITRNFRLVRLEKEAENQFFREALKRSASGMMAVEGDGTISLVNDAALQMLGVQHLHTVPELRNSHPVLADWLSGGEPGDHQIKLVSNRKMIQLAIKGTEMHLQERTVRIYSLLDITREMDRNEVEAWQKLIRVLNHEITNSVVPLHFLSTSLLDLFQVGDTYKPAGEIDDEVIEQTVLGLRALVRRSGGLSDFTSSYKSFTDMGEADFTTFRLSDMLGHIAVLLADELDRAGVKLDLSIAPSELQLLADEKLIEQTLINLVKNALYALEGVKDPVIQCRAFQSGDQVCMEVSDNGRGIPDELLDQIFIPFFSTRKGGSGIGLSLARQVMHMHNGSIRVNSREGERTTFTLTF